MKNKFRMLIFCAAIVIPACAGVGPQKADGNPLTFGQEKHAVTGLLSVVLTDNVERLKAFYRDVLGLAVQVDAGNFIQFGADQFHIAVMDRGVIGQIAGERGAIRPADRGFRFELYFRVADAEAVVRRLRQSGAVMVSPLKPRSWGDRAAYFLDPDQNLLAVADSKK